MTTYLMATNAPTVSEQLCEYLEPKVEDGDTVFALNSQKGGTGREIKERGEKALEVVEERFAEVTTVETQQIVKDNAVAEDLFDYAERKDVDELVIGIRERTTTEKLLGTVAEDIMFESDYPMHVVPRTD